MIHPEPRRTPLIAAVLFASGACSLVYQLAWLRLLRLIFGASTASTAVVLAIFMGGLGLGGLLLGRRVERARNPLAFYAALEAGIALLSAASPLLLGGVRWLYLALGGTGALGPFGATLLRIVLAAAVLGPPTLLMGGTLPAIAQAMEQAGDRGRRLVAAFYGVNTLGAVAGAFLATFVLLELLGIRFSVWAASGLNLILALVAWGLARRAGGEPVAPDGTAADEAAGRKSGARIVLPVAGVVGFLFFLMELVWYRMLAPVLGGSSYTFGLILAVALFGIGAGGTIYAFGREDRRPALSALGWTCLLEAVALGLPFAAGDHLAFLAVVLRGYGALGFSGLVLGWALITAVVVLPAALVAGYQFPLLVALLGSGRERVGSQVGQAYAWNTWGAILGSLAGGFGLLPLLSATRLWRLSVLLLALCGLTLMVYARWRPVTLAAPLAAALFALGLCAADGPSAFWRHSPIGAGRVAAASIRDPNQWRERRNQARRSVLRQAEGVESSVALIEVDDLALTINGKSDGAAVADAPTMVMFGLLGGLLHPAPREVFVVGLGSGTSAGWAASIGGVERVEVIELEPAIGELAEAFSAVNRGMSENPKVRLRYGDGRERLRTSRRSWDLILSQPSNPYRAGVADLFSRDFYRSVRERLGPGGIFVQWLQGYDVDADRLRLVYATLGSVFDHVETWQVHRADLLLVASTAPLVHDFDRLRRQVETEPFASGLRWTWRVRGIEGLYSGFVAGDDLARHLASQAERVSTDDRPRIEFGFARLVGRTGLFDLTGLRALARELGADRPRHRGAPIDWARVAEARHSRAMDGTLPAPGGDPPQVSHDRAARRSARLAYRRGQLAAAARYWWSQGQGPVTELDRLLVAETLAEAGGAAAGPAIEALRAEAPVEAELLAARLRLRRGESDAAARFLAAGLERLRADPWVFQPIAERALDLAPGLAASAPGHGERLDAALAEPFAVRLLERRRLETRLAVARVLGFASRCAELFEALEPHPPWRESWLRARLECYEANAHARLAAARKDLRAFLAAEPGSDLNDRD